MSSIISKLLKNRGGREMPLFLESIGISKGEIV